MIVLLHCVAVLLVLGGAAAALYGADTIRNESGAAWLQAGAVWAASGFVLMALAAILAELRRIRRGLSDMALEVQDLPTAATAPPPPPPFGAPAAVAAGAGVALAGAAVAAAMAAQPDAPATDTVPAGARDDVSDPGDLFNRFAGAGLPAPPPGLPVPSVGVPAPEEPVEIDEPIDLDDPELANPDPDLFADLEAAAGTDSTPHLVRTYASGGNTYLMYSDGSIEAEMDDGRYRFPSMAALRHFVETGEGGERIAPGDQPSSLPPTAPTANA
jgi:hypothetical protein